jgi:hypothetical protein
MLNIANKSRILIIFLAGTMLCLSACKALTSNGPLSAFSSNEESEHNQTKKSNLAVLQRPANGDPFILQVLSEQFDGNDSVIIRLLTQKGGEVIGSKEFVVEDLFNSYGTFGSSSAKLEKTYQYKFGLSIPATQGSEYQLELLWGEEALPYLGKNNLGQKDSLKLPEPLQTSRAGSELTTGRNVPLPDAKNIELQGLRISKKRYCYEQQECQIEFQITAEIVNLSNEVVKSAMIAVGFLDKEGEAYKYGVRIPEEEELVELPNLSLQAKNSQSIKLVLDQKVPESMDRRYQPVLRLVQK